MCTWILPFTPASTRGTGSRAAHHVEAEHLAVEVLGALEVVRADEEVVQLGDGHAAAPAAGTATLLPKDEVHFALPQIPRYRRQKWARMIELTASDGHKLSAYRAEPKGKPRGWPDRVQEIFGVNGHIRSVADGYAADGYLAVARRSSTASSGGWTSATPAGHREGPRLYPEDAMDTVMKDAGAALDNVKSSGKVGIVGYCWAGRYRGWRRRASGPRLRRVLLRRRHPEQRR